MAILIFLVIVCLIPLVFVFAQFNSLVSLRNHLDNSWKNIGTELQRRYDLIPNLVASVKGYAAHEREVLERVTQLRNTCIQNSGPNHQQDEQQLVFAMQRMLAVVEKYPQLKADQHFLALQHELTNTENRIQAARRFYNGNVRDYRTKCQSFPSNIVAAIFGFQLRDYFNVESSVNEVPTAQIVR